MQLADMTVHNLHNILLIQLVIIYLVIITILETCVKNKSYHNSSKNNLGSGLQDNLCWHVAVIMSVYWSHSQYYLCK